MKILFLHQNMPGQYKYLCRAFAANPNNQVVFLTKPKNFDIPNVIKVEYKVPREASVSTHRYLTQAERGVLAGQEVWRMCNKLKNTEHFTPDVIVCHPGWGDALFIKDIYPDVPLLSFLEFFYRSKGADVGFDVQDPAKVDDGPRVRIKNTVNLQSLDSMDWGISPTLWQHSLHPDAYKNRISVLHDGIDTEKCVPDGKASLTINNITYNAGDETVTYIARNFEPYRGFPTFMKAADIILKKRPNCRILAVGADEISYGRQLKPGETWRHKMLADIPSLQNERLIFPGVLSYDNLIKLFQISAAHIYLTYPFVLSWSSMEAMSCGCAMIASDTMPVREVMQDGHNALLADFFSPEQVAQQVIKALEGGDEIRAMRAAARQTIVDDHALNDVLPLHQQLITDLADRKIPPPAHEMIMARHQTSDFPQLLEQQTNKAA